MKHWIVIDCVPKTTTHIAIVITLYPTVYPTVMRIIALNSRFLLNLNETHSIIVIV